MQLRPTLNFSQLEIYLKCLGRSHADLVAEQIVTAEKLIEVYPDPLTLYLEPEPGLYLVFWAETKIFETLIICRAKTFPDAVVYSAELPEPYGGFVNREVVLATLGQPYESKGPYKMPLPSGEAGGWDSFEIFGGGHDSLGFTANYDCQLNVVQLAFSLKKTALDIELEEYERQKDKSGLPASESEGQ
ncbi:DUF6392 family protein [Pseudomonas sp.]|uniref:DUF6392 family protein n=1 Tax=Pseudomonas sp. TaxID=306 RepID=UPI0028A6E6BB|nr:hypothetical protein [Pseudomonas sp.]